MKEIFKALGAMFQFWAMLSREVQYQDCTEEDMETVLVDKRVCRRIAELIKGHPQSSKSREAEAKAAVRREKWAAGTYKVVIDYALPFEEMVRAGNYGGVSKAITSEHFPISGEGKVERELVLVPFTPINEVIHARDVLAELDRQGLRPAKIEELLAFGATYPKPQKDFPIVALGSFCVPLDGCGDYFAYLDRGVAMRVLRLEGFWDRWLLRRGNNCHFLAVRKDTEPTK